MSTMKMGTLAWKDVIAAERRVIAFDNRGVGASGGSVPHTVEGMARDAIALVEAGRELRR